VKEGGSGVPAASLQCLASPARALPGEHRDARTAAAIRGNLTAVPLESVVLAEAAPPPEGVDVDDRMPQPWDQD